MKIKYVRTELGNIYCNINDKNIKVGTKWVSYLKPTVYRYYTFKELIIKVANTPMALIEVGDLIECPYEFIGIKEVIGFRGQIYGGIEYDGDWKHYTITKILTPNSNGGYDKQWEAE